MPKTYASCGSTRRAKSCLAIRRARSSAGGIASCFLCAEADFFTATDRKALQEQSLFDIACEPIQTRSRGVRLLHTKKLPLNDERGRPAYLLGISEDVTERVYAENELKKFEMIVSATQEQMAFVDCSFAIQAVNRAFLEARDKRRDEVVGHSIAAR